MSGQPDTVEECCYAEERLVQLQSNILHQITGMVVQRARVEKYRLINLNRAKDSYSELQKLRHGLIASLTDARPLLMELEAQNLSAMAGQLCTGLAGFDLMARNYKPVYDAICGVANQFPTGEKANAQVIGRLMNRVKMGYYPTDSENISHLLRGIQFPAGVTTNLLDPCCGCGKALRQLAQGNNCYTYGVELDEFRAEEAQTRLHRVGMGSFFHSRISHEAFHLLFLNPPYLSVIQPGGYRSRHEKRFLVESICHLMYGGLLIYVIPYYRLTEDICRFLCQNFEQLSVWRFTDREFQKFKQIAVMGIRRKRDDEAQEADWLVHYSVEPDSIPSIVTLQKSRYMLPEKTCKINTFRGEKFNKRELAQQLQRSDSFAKLMAHNELDSGVKHPPLPLSIGQIGLIGGSGMINGLIECDTPHIIEGRIIKVVHTETEEKFSDRGAHIGSEVTETIINKMIFNVLTPTGFKALT